MFYKQAKKYLLKIMKIIKFPSNTFKMILKWGLQLYLKSIYLNFNFFITPQRMININSNFNNKSRFLLKN